MRVDAVPVPELPLKAATVSSRLFGFVTGPRLISVRGLAGAVVWCSVVMFVAAFLYGLLLLGPLNLRMLWTTGPWKLSAAQLVFLNALTATPSFLLTMWVARNAEKNPHRGFMVKLFAVILLCLLLALANFQLGLHGSFSGAVKSLTFERFIAPLAVYPSFLQLQQGMEDTFFQLAISTGSFLLDMVLLGSIGGLVLLKFVLLAGRWLLKRFLEAATEKPVESLAPFSMLGVFINLLVTLFKLVHLLLAPTT
jgi:hypothetical protein